MKNVNCVDTDPHILQSCYLGLPAGSHLDGPGVPSTFFSSQEFRARSSLTLSSNSSRSRASAISESFCSSCARPSRGSETLPADTQTASHGEPGAGRDTKARRPIAKYQSQGLERRGEGRTDRAMGGEAHSSFRPFFSVRLPSRIAEAPPSVPVPY